MPDLLGYGPHTIAADDDYDVKCAPRGSRQSRLTIGLTITGGNFTVKSRKRGSSGAFSTQAYTLPDESQASTALAASTVVYVDATGKDIRITGAGGAAGTLEFDVASEH